MNEKQARAIVYARSGGICETCRRFRATDWSHRVSRAQGGPWAPSNGLHACRVCHSWMHHNPNDANDLGWYLRSWQNPLTEPVVLRGRKVWLTDAGSYAAVAPWEATA